MVTGKSYDDAYKFNGQCQSDGLVSWWTPNFDGMQKCNGTEKSVMFMTSSYVDVIFVMSIYHYHNVSR